MRFRDPVAIERERVSKWHRWWAWFAVPIQGTETLVRWEWVERQCHTFDPVAYNESRWIYRLPKDSP